MKSAFLLVCLAVGAFCAPVNFEEQVFEQEVLKSGVLCNLLTAVENFIEPGLDEYFEEQCVPQITTAIQMCSGDLEAQIKAISEQLCNLAADKVSTLIDKLPGFLKNVFGPIFQPDGPFLKVCDKSLEAYIGKELKQECAVIKELKPKEVCEQTFKQLWGQLTNTLNQEFCKE